MAVTFLTNEDGKKFVKSINNVQPDENGNVEITIENPDVDLTGYATEEWVQESYQPKGEYLTEHQDISGKLDANKLPEAINSALAQAKASGEFDGADGKDYILTTDDKAEIAEMAADLVDVPDYTDSTDEVYILSENETLADVPDGIIVVIDPDGKPDFDIPNGGNVELDTTLTQSGKAADAKAVGDKIAEITGISLVEPAEDDIPKVFITGVKPTTKDDVLAEMEYVSKTDKFHAYLTIKCQGTSSMNYPKKNFTVKMFADEARETKLNKSFKDWNHNGNKYVLKANYIDHSHARNIVSARLWGEVVTSRPDYNSLPVEMRNAPNNGAVDGFPIKVYYNGNYEGVYTWNIGKDDWQWGMDEDNPNHVLMCAETNTNGNKTATPCNFRSLWNGVNESNWSVEVGTNSTALKNSLNNLIQFVMDNDGDAFRNGIGNYLDIQSAIDYYIFQYEICGLDGLAKNMLLATYDGKKWICGAYDMDSTFGMWWNGESFVAATFACPEDYQEDYSLLWERIEANFLPELKARQAELRKTVLSYSNMVTHFERFMDIIGLDLYAEDLTIYTGIPSGSTNNIKQIRNYIRDRQAYVDAEFAAMTEPVPCTGITMDKTTLTLTAEGTQTLTATASPDGCSDAMVWVSSSPSIAMISVEGNVCIVTPVANGSTTITVTCGEHSASCSVSVSGFSEPVPCTGITLDKSELTFNGEGSQTITATVTPADTTDAIVWSSDIPDVANVVDGVVTAKKNGTAIITATCGTQSATCAVTVSGIVGIDYTLNPLIGLTWQNKKGFSYSTGALTDSNTDAVSSTFALQDCMYTLTPGANKYVRVIVYDKDGNYVGVFGNGSGTQSIYFTALSKYVYALTCNATDGTQISESLTLMPKDNSGTTVSRTEVDLSIQEWTVPSGRNNMECKLFDDIKPLYNTIDSCNYIMCTTGMAASGFERGSYLYDVDTVFIHFGHHQAYGIVNTPHFGNDVDAAKAWFAEHEPLIINARH